MEQVSISRETARWIAIYQDCKRIAQIIVNALNDDDTIDTDKLITSPLMECLGKLNELVLHEVNRHLVEDEVEGSLCD